MHSRHYYDIIREYVYIPAVLIIQLSDVRMIGIRYQDYRSKGNVHYLIYFIMK